MRNLMLCLVLAAVALAVQPSPADAQGSANPAKAKSGASNASSPDLSGYWNIKGGSPSWDPADPGGKNPGGLPMVPWARQKLEAARPPFGANATYDSVNDPVQKYCDPPGVTRLYQYPYEFLFIQTPGTVYILYEFSRVWRMIPLNKEHPKDPDATWMGDSVGKYEGDTLIIDTVGFNDKTWIDQLGHPHSDALHLVERIRRTDAETLEVEVSFDDPKAYTKPFSAKRTFTRSSSPPTEALCSASEMQAFQDQVMTPTVQPPKK
jgi:hypothetical protein